MDDRVAEVVCRQMGWAKGRLVELSIVTDAPGTRQVWMDNMNCPSWPSTETHVEQCDHNNKDARNKRLHAREGRNDNTGEDT